MYCTSRQYIILYFYELYSPVHKAYIRTYYLTSMYCELLQKKIENAFIYVA